MLLGNELGIIACTLGGGLWGEEALYDEEGESVKELMTVLPESNLGETKLPRLPELTWVGLREGGVRPGVFAGRLAVF